MHRFSVVYLLKKQYQHIDCETHSEADSLLEELSAREEYKPIGIYDAKTELFHWEPTRQLQYDKSSIEKQGKLGDQITQISQSLRQREEPANVPSNSIAQLLSLEAESPI